MSEGKKKERLGKKKGGKKGRKESKDPSQGKWKTYTSGRRGFWGV